MKTVNNKINLMQGSIHPRLEIDEQSPFILIINRICESREISIK